MMMQKKMKNIMCCVLAAALMLPTAVYSLPANAEPEEKAAESEKPAESTGSTADDSEEWVTRTPEDVFAKMKLAAENDALEFWVWDQEKVDTDSGEKPEDIFALKNKKNGYVWWSSPINAQGDSIATPVLKAELASAVVLTAAQIDERSTTNVRSGDTNRTGIVMTDITDGVKVVYNFRKPGIKVPVKYTLKADYLEVSIDTKDISEKYGPDSEESKVLAQQLAVCNSFGAADSQEEGYFVIPDGSGALINFNNRKYTARTYSQLIYDVDTTAVPKTKGAVVEGVSLPMFGIVKGENAMLAVADKGDGSCYLCSDGSGTGQSNTEYNRCYFKFLLRSSDQYYMGSDSANALDVYEKLMPERELRVRYYPLCPQDEINEDGGSTLDYVDVAARYRKYLTEDEKVKTTAKANSSSLFIDLYGGCMKQKNVLGFPVFMKTSMTSFDEMQKILEQVKAAGADDLTVAINRWTNAGIEGEVDYKAKPAGTLGGKSGFRKLTDYMDSSGITWYPAVSNTAYYSGNGYWSLTDTAVRVSGSFARIVDYERAYGVPYGKKKTMSLLSPSVFPELYDKLLNNYQDFGGFKGISIGKLSSALYGDYGKKSATSREKTMQYIEDSLGKMRTGLGSVLSEDPSAYVLPYTDVITDMPLYSSGFYLFDREIPLYQIVMHGVIPYATKAVNGSADAERMVMLAAASGSNLRFDLLHAETSELKDTDFDVFYYAYYEYWVKNAAQYDSFIRDILRASSDSHIISYTQEGDVITTKYANGTVTETNLADCSVTLNGQTRYLRDYVEEGADVFK